MRSTYCASFLCKLRYLDVYGDDVLSLYNLLMSSTELTAGKLISLPYLSIIINTEGDQESERSINDATNSEILRA